MQALTVIILLIGIGALIFLYYDNSRKQEKKRLVFIAQITRLFPAIKECSSQFDSLITYENGYVNSYKLRCWQREAETLLTEVKKIPYGKINLDKNSVDEINSLFWKYNDRELSRTNFNKSFVEHELLKYKEFFNDIEGRELDDQQRRAVITDEDNNIVVAGAGSGKTTTVAGKVSYLIERYKIKPSEILLISFTRKACEEMQKRIKLKMNIDIDVMTFHKLGLEIIAAVTKRKPSIFDDGNFKNLINGFLAAQLKDQVYLSKVTRFFTEYLKPYKEESEFKSQGEYIQYIKDNKVQVLSSVQRVRKRYGKYSIQFQRTMLPILRSSSQHFLRCRNQIITQ